MLEKRIALLSPRPLSSCFDLSEKRKAGCSVEESVYYLTSLHGFNRHKAVSMAADGLTLFEIIFSEAMLFATIISCAAKGRFPRETPFKRVFSPPILIKLMYNFLNKNSPIEILSFSMRMLLRNILFYILPISLSLGFCAGFKKRTWRK